MAKLRTTNTNELIKTLSGALGGLVFRPMPDGSVVVSTPPHYGRHRKYSQGQKDHQRRFKEAASYARYAAKTQPIYAELAAGTMKTPYNIALSDWFNQPIVKQIVRREGEIFVEASDNVMVTRVQVTLLDEEGKVLEKGEATRGEGDWWEYASTLEGTTVMAEAWDLPGHVSKLAVK
jgi:hypothetical protein